MNAAYAAGVDAARQLYRVKVGLELPGTEYGPRYLERRTDDAARVKDQVGHLFDRFQSRDVDSNFPMPGVMHAAVG